MTEKKKGDGAVIRTSLFQIRHDSSVMHQYVHRVCTYQVLCTSGPIHQERQYLHPTVDILATTKQIDLKYR